MAFKLTGLRVFSSHARGLDAERKLFRETVQGFNEDFGHDRDYVLIAVGWETVPPSVGDLKTLSMHL